MALNNFTLADGYQYFVPHFHTDARLLPKTIQSQTAFCDFSHHKSPSSRGQSKHESKPHKHRQRQTHLSTVIRRRESTLEAVHRGASRWKRGDGHEESSGRRSRLAVLGPLVLTADLVLLLGCEVVLDVEGLADLIRRLALDHVGDRLATNVEEGLDVEVVGGLCIMVSALFVDADYRTECVPR